VGKFLDIRYWLAVARSPTAVTGLLVDIAPVVGILLWGWGAPALVLLYWLENLVIGAVTIPRILTSALVTRGWTGLFGAAYLAAFFTVHYGLFCLAHGAILLEVFDPKENWSTSGGFGDLVELLISAALGFGRHMTWIVALIAVWHAMVLLRDLSNVDNWKDTDPNKEMFMPYGRIIFLHIGVFVIAGALTALGDPAIGAIALVLARALWGLHMNMRSRQKAQPAPVPA